MLIDTIKMVSVYLKQRKIYPLDCLHRSWSVLLNIIHFIKPVSSGTPLESSGGNSYLLLGPEFCNSCFYYKALFKDAKIRIPQICCIAHGFLPNS